MDDSDFPTRLAGEALGLPPLQLQAGLRQGYNLAAMMRQAAPSAAMAPEHSEPHWSALGAVQPEVTFGV